MRTKKIMRKLKLQMQITVDGFVARPNGELDWMKVEENDKKLWEHVNALTDSSDTILMGRKMTDVFINYWTNVQSDSPEYEFAQKMINIPKIVFSRTLTESPWINTTIKNDLVPDVTALKQQNGKDILVYGGAGFVTSLIKENLIDEYNLFVNPVAIGDGMTIFKESGTTFDLKQVDATPYKCGVTVHKYLPAKASNAAAS